MSEGRVIREIVDKREPLRMELEDFVDAVRNGREPRVRGIDSLRALRVASALVKSGITNQPITMGPLEE